MNYFLGIDIGGTKSHAMIVDQTGEILGFYESGAGNHEVVHEYVPIAFIHIGPRGRVPRKMIGRRAALVTIDVRR